MIEVLNEVPKSIQVGGTEYRISRRGPEGIWITLVKSGDRLPAMKVVPATSNVIYVGPDLEGIMRL